MTTDGLRRCAIAVNVGPGWVIEDVAFDQDNAQRGYWIARSSRAMTTDGLRRCAIAHSVLVITRLDRVIQ
jgi:hypothetical protein